MRLAGCARDLATRVLNARPLMIAQDKFEATVNPDMTIETITCEPYHQALDQLIGVRCGGKLRKIMATTLSCEVGVEAPLNLILDDIVGVMLVSSAAWIDWEPDWFKQLYGNVAVGTLVKARQGACIAHSPGFSAQDPTGATADYGTALAVAPWREEDPEGWHEMATQRSVGLRRLRCIDVSHTDVITIDTTFQDSASRPDGKRRAIHEYGLSVTADLQSLEILSIYADPRVLPYPECPTAAANLTKLLGVNLLAIESVVSERLAGTSGCTHLNDALRALKSLPALLKQIG